MVPNVGSTALITVVGLELGIEVDIGSASGVLALDDLVLAVTLIGAQMTCWGSHITECLIIIGSIDKSTAVALC